METLFFIRTRAYHRKQVKTMQTQLQEQQRRTALILRVFLGFLIGITATVGIFLLLSIILVKAMQQKGLRDKIRAFNKYTLNPATLNIAGNRLRIYSSVKHVGRRSGREYATPVVAEPLGDGFAIPLPYGANVDWHRNVMAAGKCTLRWNEQDYSLEKPEIITSSDALGAFPFVQRIIFSAGGIKQYVWLHQQKKAPAASKPVL